MVMCFVSYCFKVIDCIVFHEIAEVFVNIVFWDFK